MSTSATVTLSHRRGQAAHDRVTEHVPDLAPVLASISVTTPQQAWLTQQGRANTAAHKLLTDDHTRGDAARRFVTHTAAQILPAVSLRDVTDAVVHALSMPAAVEDRHVLKIDQDTALATVMYVVGRRALDPDVYRRAVAPLVQAFADVPFHPAEYPADHLNPEHDRGVAFRAGYRDATHDDPHSDDEAARMYHGHADAYAAGYLAARQDQTPA